MSDAFNGDDQNTETPENYLDALVGEGKKFESPEALAKGKYEADEYIKVLISERDQIRAEADKAKTANEVADELRRQIAEMQTSSNQNQNLGDGENGGNAQETNTTTISPEDVNKLVESRLDELERKSRHQANLDEVNKVLDEKIGATAGSYVTQKAKELGVTVEYLEQQAAVSPKAFYNLVGLGANQTSVPNAGTPPKTSVNTGGLGQGATVKNKAYFDKLYKENPELRLDKKTTLEEHRMAKELGDEFWG